MTANEIITAGFGLAGEKLTDFPDKNIAIIWLNMAIGDSFDTEKLIREKKGLEIPGVVQRIYSVNDEVDMDQAITAGCLPYGIAAYLCADREKEGLYARYSEKFNLRLKKAAKGLEKPIEDFYKGGI